MKFFGQLSNEDQTKDVKTDIEWIYNYRTKDIQPTTLC